MPTPLRVLIVEDQPDDAELVVRELHREGFAPVWERVQTEATYLEHLSGSLDVILADYTLPQFDALRALQLAQERGLDIPFLIVSGTIREDVAVECMKRGASDYLLKDRLSRLGPAVTQALGARQLRAARKQAEEAVREEGQVTAALAKVGRELIASLDTPVMLERLCRLTTEVLAGGCGCTLLRRSQETGYAVIATFGCSPLQKEALTILQASPEATERLAQRLAAEEVVEITERLSPAGFPQAFWRQCGLGKLLCVALRRGQDLIGIQICGYGKLEAFAPYQLRIARGISQVASLTLANAILLEELERANRLKSDFVATMSHELRTPLNIIMGYTDLLRDGQFGPLTPDQLDPLERVDTNAKELLNLITATLDVSRLEAGRLPVEIQEVSVADLVGELRREVELNHDRANLEVSWRVAPDTPPVSSDWIKLKVILKNLVHNAIKFTETGGVTVDARPRDGGVEFRVSDTGIGIAPDALPVIFEMFRQADGSATRRYGGVGLGLYIVRRLLALLGGTVAVESEPGRGSTFRVWVPSAAPNKT